MIKDAKKRPLFYMSELPQFIREIHTTVKDTGQIRRYSLVDALKGFGRTSPSNETHQKSYDSPEHALQAEASGIAAMYLSDMWPFLSDNLEKELSSTHDVRVRRFRVLPTLSKYEMLKKQTDGLLKRSVDTWFGQHKIKADEQQRRVYSRYCTVLDELDDPVFSSPNQHIISGTRTAVHMMIDLMYVVHEVVQRQYGNKLELPIIIRAVMKQVRTITSALAQVDIGVANQFRNVLGVDGGKNGIQLDTFVIDETVSDTGVSTYNLAITEEAQSHIAAQYTQANHMEPGDEPYPSLGCPILVVPGRDRAGAKDDLFNTLYSVVEREILPLISG